MCHGFRCHSKQGDVNDSQAIVRGFFGRVHGGRSYNWGSRFRVCEKPVEVETREAMLDRS
jgi:hypothetical protein